MGNTISSLCLRVALCALLFGSAQAMWGKKKWRCRSCGNKFEDGDDNPKYRCDNFSLDQDRKAVMYGPKRKTGKASLSILCALAFKTKDGSKVLRNSPKNRMCKDCSRIVNVPHMYLSFTNDKLIAGDAELLKASEASKGKQFAFNVVCKECEKALPKLNRELGDAISKIKFLGLADAAKDKVDAKKPSKNITEGMIVQVINIKEFEEKTGKVVRAGGKRGTWHVKIGNDKSMPRIFSEENLVPQKRSSPTLEDADTNSPALSLTESDL